MIEIKDKKDCCGCNACGDICAHKAITFKTDIEGFWYPEVNKDKCTDCGLCEKVCPIINAKELKKNDFEEPICYAAMHKNLAVRFDSTSGGLFSAFAEKMYRDKGYVGGAVFNDDFTVKQYISNQKQDIGRLRSSKYQQSNCEGIFKEIRNLLKAGEKVLICGCPCQMAALRAYLNKTYDNLLIVDFVCKGINSPKMSKSFRSWLEAKHNSKIVYWKAKSKDLGWQNLTTKIRYANGDNEYLTKDINVFTRGYLQTGAYMRPSCYDCQFRGFPRISDITLADFWGIEKYAPEMHDNIGTSLVLINSKKGEKFYTQISQKIKSLKLEIDVAIKGNPALIKSPALPKIDREKMFSDIDRLDFGQLAEKYFPVPQLNAKQKIKKSFRLIKALKHSFDYLNWRPCAIYRFFKFNLFYSKIKTCSLTQGFVLPTSFSIVSISSKANLILNAPLRIGSKRMKYSRLETRFLVEEEANVIIDGQFGFGYGSDVEVFKGATLHIKGAEFKSRSGANIGLTLICGDRIEIGYDVQIGRNVTIRDNNGGHYISLQGYKISKPVIIGNHVWLCESCTIMQGVKIGDGAIIGAHAVVTSNVPAYSLVAGNPAKVVQRDVCWKY